MQGTISAQSTIIDQLKLLNERDDPSLESSSNQIATNLSDGLTEDAKKFIHELNLKNPGENGVPVKFSENSSEVIKKLIAEGYEKYGFNQFASTLVSLNRVLPDIRPQECMEKVYRIESFVKVSIVIGIYNDDWTLLMRFIHSIIRLSSLHLIQEILIVDDDSTHDHLFEKLENYTSTLPVNVRIIRSHTRLGPIIIYVDSHIEVHTEWLEPILDRFVDNMDLVVFPNVSDLNRDDFSENFKYKAEQIYLFNWGMHEIYADLKWFNGNKTTPIFEPRIAPVGTGSVIAVGREFLKRIGYFDSQFDIWGGEDYELSIRAWLCGGRAEFVPCSTVGHMYRTHKYSHKSKGKGGYRWNMDRIAELWMDDYKEYYYSDVEEHNRIFGDLTERIEIKERLNCKSFQWYIDNVYPRLMDINVKDKKPTRSPN